MGAASSKPETPQYDSHHTIKGPQGRPRSSLQLQARSHRIQCTGIGKINRGTPEGLSKRRCNKHLTKVTKANKKKPGRNGKSLLRKSGNTGRKRLRNNGREKQKINVQRSILGRLRPPNAPIYIFKGLPHIRQLCDRGNTPRNLGKRKRGDNSDTTECKSGRKRRATGKQTKSKKGRKPGNNKNRRDGERRRRLQDGKPTKNGANAAPDTTAWSLF
jgi:hypothetical protein